MTEEAAADRLIDLREEWLEARKCRTSRMAAAGTLPKLTEGAGADAGSPGPPRPPTRRPRG